MTSTRNEKTLWLVAGVLAGLLIANVWPHETVSAGTTDRNDKFAIVTVPAAPLLDSVFVFDFLTGNLVGATMDPAVGKFKIAYGRNVAQDFGISPRVRPVYGIATGNMPLENNSSAQGVIYISELTSGKVAAYTYATNRVGAGAGPLVVLDVFPFREITPE